MWVPPLLPLPALNAANFHPEGKARRHGVDPLSTASCSFCGRDGLWLFSPHITCSPKHCWLIPPSAMSVRDRGLPPASTPRARVPTLEPVGQAGWRLSSPLAILQRGGQGVHLEKPFWSGAPWPQLLPPWGEPLGGSGGLRGPSSLLPTSPKHHTACWLTSHAKHLLCMALLPETARTHPGPRILQVRGG